MTDKPLPSPELLRKLLRYEPDTGLLYWLPRGREFFATNKSHAVWNSSFSGKLALNASAVQGYREGTVLFKRVTAHRVIWALVHGAWPKNIDHINGNRADNRLCNLREVTRGENQLNQKQNSKNTSGHMGVWRQGTRWIAEIKFQRRKRYLGSFATFESAVKARQAAEAELGFHRNHGR